MRDGTPDNRCCPRSVLDGITSPGAALCAARGESMLRLVYAQGEMVFETFLEGFDSN